MGEKVFKKKMESTVGKAISLKKKNALAPLFPKEQLFFNYL